jgi:hypothetical protein
LLLIVGSAGADPSAIVYLSTAHPPPPPEIVNEICPPLHPIPPPNGQLDVIEVGAVKLPGQVLHAVVVATLLDCPLKYAIAFIVVVPEEHIAAPIFCCSHDVGVVVTK